MSRRRLLKYYRKPYEAAVSEVIHTVAALDTSAIPYKKQEQVLRQLPMYSTIQQVLFDQYFLFCTQRKQTLFDNWLQEKFGCRIHGDVFPYSFTIDQLQMLFEDSPSYQEISNFADKYKEHNNKREKFVKKREKLQEEREDLERILSYQVFLETKWFPSYYSMKDHIEWFADLIASHLFNPLQTDPEVKAFIEEVFSTQISPLAFFYSVPDEETHE